MTNLTAQIEIKFLRQGDRIRIVDEKTGKERFAICTMDGHAVSDNYGWLANPNSIEYFSDPENDYINVLFEDTTYAPEGSYERIIKPNHTIKQAGITVYTDSKRVGQSRNWLAWYKNGTLAVRLAEQKIKDATAIIKEQQTIIEQQERVLADAQMVAAA